MSELCTHPQHMQHAVLAMFFCGVSALCCGCAAPFLFFAGVGARCCFNCGCGARSAFAAGERAHCCLGTFLGGIFCCGYGAAEETRPISSANSPVSKGVLYPQHQRTVRSRTRSNKGAHAPAAKNRVPAHLQQKKQQAALPQQTAPRAHKEALLLFISLRVKSVHS